MQLSHFQLNCLSVLISQVLPFTFTEVLRFDFQMYMFYLLIVAQFKWFHFFAAQHGLANDIHWLWKDYITGNKIKCNVRWAVITSKQAMFFPGSLFKIA